MVQSFSQIPLLNTIIDIIIQINFGRDDERVSVSSKILTEVAKWMERFDCIVVGPGLGRDSFLLVRLLIMSNEYNTSFFLWSIATIYELLYITLDGRDILALTSITFVLLFRTVSKC
jgi:hypothetical protein